VRSRAITKRLRTSMLYARRRGSRRPPPPRVPAARSANCRPPLRRETKLNSGSCAATVFCLRLYQPPHSKAPRGGGASKACPELVEGNSPVGPAGLAGSYAPFETRLRRSSGRGGGWRAISIVPGHRAIRSTRDRHCEPSGVERRPSFRTGYGEAIQGNIGRPCSLDRRAARPLLAITAPSPLPRL
jgi:hypothetical protein